MLYFLSLASRSKVCRPRAWGFFELFPFWKQLIFTIVRCKIVMKGGAIMFSFFTNVTKDRQKMEQSKKEMELRHKEFADRVRMDIKTGEEELALKRECFNQRYGHLFRPRNK